MRRRPFVSEYDPYYEPYVNAVPDGDVIDILVRECAKTVDYFESIPLEKAHYRYEADKWSVCEVMGHMVDTERIFAYRALSIARGDQSALPGMDQDQFMLGAGFNERGMASISREFQFLRSSSIELFQSFPSDVLDRKGVASGLEFSVRAFIYITAGHAIHHLGVLRERYA